MLENLAVIISRLRLVYLCCRLGFGRCILVEAPPVNRMEISNFWLSISIRTAFHLLNPTWRCFTSKVFLATHFSRKLRNTVYQSAFGLWGCQVVSTPVLRTVFTARQPAGTPCYARATKPKLPSHIYRYIKSYFPFLQAA